MKRRFRHAFLGAALVAATVAAPPIATTAGAQATAWDGFTAISAPSDIDLNEDGGITNDSPAFSAAVTEDLGGDGFDLWVNNHAVSSETLVDFGGTTTATLFEDVDRITQAGAGAILSDSHVGAFTDIDGDGDEDFIETAGAGDATRIFENQNGTLVQTGTLGDPLMRARTVLMVDIDDDGDMDALVTALDSRFNDVDEDGEPDIAPSALFENDGDGNFTEVADTDSILFDETEPLENAAQNVRYAVLTSTGIGTDQVIVTANQFSVGLNTLALGDAELVEGNRISQATGEINNASAIRDLAFGELDGNLSNGPEFVAARQNDTDDEGDTNDDGQAIGDGIPDFLGELPISIRTVSGNGGLSPVSESDLADNCATISLADFDNDADLDIFGGCAFSPGGQTQNVVLLNDGNGNFGTPLPVAGMPTTAAVSLVADFNGDGWVDTYVGGGFDAEPGEDFVLLNDGGNDNNFLQIDLEATNNPDANGAQVYVGTDIWQVRETGHTLHRGQDSRTLHFGLGEQAAIAPLEIRWPDGTFETCTVGGGVNQRVTVTQGSGACETSNRAGLEAAIAADPVVDVPDVALCNGLAATVTGLTGTTGDDVIIGTSGNDTINGLGGADVICGGDGDDTINGGAGPDMIFGEAGDDDINGAKGDDVISGGNGADRVAGGKGTDEVSGNSGADLVRGNKGRDTLSGGKGSDQLRGHAGADVLNGGNGQDNLGGGTGADVLNGGGGIDEVNGGNGDDTCIADPDGRSEVQANCEN